MNGHSEYYRRAKEMPNGLGPQATLMSQAVAHTAVPRWGIPAWIESVRFRLGPNEFRRRLWHFAPGVMALLGAAIPYYEPVPPYVLVLTALFCLGIACIAICFQHSIRRPSEQNCLTAIAGYGVSVIPLFLLFPAQPELALTVAAIIAFGDGSATLIGLLVGATKLPWNRHKSWAGTSAFVLAGLPTAALVWWAASVPHSSPGIALLCAAPAVLASALVESLPIRLNDNVFVGACAAISVICMHGAVVGWT